jgi:hypothetical protein
MRQGQNPLRTQNAPYKMKDIICLVVTHLPCEEEPGYHKDRMEVVQTCLETMRNGIHREHTFMVWDNDSNSTFRDWLQHIFEPDVLVMSKNIGKNQARANAINTLPLGGVVCYSDDDIFFEDNWFNPQYELLYSFPKVAAVSGMPIRTMMRWGNENTLKWARENAKVKQGRFISPELEKDYAISIGREPQQHIEMTVKDIDYLIEYEDKKAYAHAHHAQFIGYVATVRNGMYVDDMALTDEKPTDILLDKLGLRLCTTERYCRHMGNIMEDVFRRVKENVR